MAIFQLKKLFFNLIIELKEISYNQLSYVLQNIPDDNEDCNKFLNNLLTNGIPEQILQDDTGEGINNVYDESLVLNYHSILRFDFHYKKSLNILRVINKYF